MKKLKIWKILNMEWTSINRANTNEKVHRRANAETKTQLVHLLSRMLEKRIGNMTRKLDKHAQHQTKIYPRSHRKVPFVATWNFGSWISLFWFFDLDLWILEFRFWSLYFGYWIWKFWFWNLDWNLDFGVLSLAVFWILNGCFYSFLWWDGWEGLVCRMRAWCVVIIRSQPCRMASTTWTYSGFLMVLILQDVLQTGGLGRWMEHMKLHDQGCLFCTGFKYMAAAGKSSCSVFAIRVGDTPYRGHGGPK